MGAAALNYAIISDIHANLQATETVLKDIDKRGVDHIVCLGDVVGYGADPNRCVELMVEREIPTICGNHDAVASGLEEPWGFNPVAKQSVMWTRKALSESNLEWLRSLHDTDRIDSFLAVHGSPTDRNTYLLTWEDVLAQMDYVDKLPVNVCFFGHTHTPGIFARDGVYSVNGTGTFDLAADKLFFINPGSVGQPRDGDPRAAYGVYDSEKRHFELIRLTYPVEKAAERIVEEGLPPVLGERLFLGR